MLLLACVRNFVRGFVRIFCLCVRGFVRSSVRCKSVSVGSFVRRLKTFLNYRHETDQTLEDKMRTFYLQAYPVVCAKGETPLKPCAVLRTSKSLPPRPARWSTLHVTGLKIRSRSPFQPGRKDRVLRIEGLFSLKSPVSQSGA